MISPLLQSSSLHADPSPGREHHYWDCPVAQAVIESIETALTPRPAFC